MEEIVKLISEATIKEHLTMKRTIEICEKLYAAYGQGKVIMPPKLGMPLGAHGQWPGQDANLTALPCFIQYAADDEILGMKWIWAFYNNKRDYGIPWIGAFIILNHPRCGKALAIFEGAYITDMRTGAATAAVAKKLMNSNPQKTISIFGAGMQGRMHARAMKEVTEIKELKIYDAFPAAAEKFAEDMRKELGLNISVASTREDACIDSDIIITCSVANEPLVDKCWLKAGCTVISVGSYLELADNVVLEADKLYVDSWAQLCKPGKGDIGPRVEAGTLTYEMLTGEVPDLMAGNVYGRENDDEIICSCSIGMGLLDVGVAGELYKNDFKEYHEHTMEFR